MDIEEVARKIESMEIRGAAKIAQSAAMALKNLAMESNISDPEEFKDMVKEKADRLVSTRPTAVSLRNAVSMVLKGMDKSDNMADLKEGIVKKAQTFIENSQKALEIIADIGSKRISDKDVILTHCNSTAAVSTIIKAHSQGKRIHVFATESRPKRQGYITARTLSEAGVPTTLIVDSAVRYVMHEIDLVIVGADTVASNGAVINKIGTSQIALCAHEVRVPVMVCAETYKFSPETVDGELIKIEEREVKEVVDPKDFPNVRIFNPVFDATPPEYIDVIVTELGVISPHAAYEIIKSMENEN